MLLRDPRESTLELNKLALHYHVLWGRLSCQTIMMHLQSLEIREYLERKENRKQVQTYNLRHHSNHK